MLTRTREKKKKNRKRSWLRLKCLVLSLYSINNSFNRNNNHIARTPAPVQTPPRRQFLGPDPYISFPWGLQASRARGSQSPIRFHQARHRGAGFRNTSGECGQRKKKPYHGCQLKVNLIDPRSSLFCLATCRNSCGLHYSTVRHHICPLKTNPYS